MISVDYFRPVNLFLVAAVFVLDRVAFGIFLDAFADKALQVFIQSDFLKQRTVLAFLRAVCKLGIVLGAFGIFEVAVAFSLLHDLGVCAGVYFLLPFVRCGIAVFVVAAQHPEEVAGVNLHTVEPVSGFAENGLGFAFAVLIDLVFERNLVAVFDTSGLICFCGEIVERLICGHPVNISCSAGRDFTVKIISILLSVSKTLEQMNRVVINDEPNARFAPVVLQHMIHLGCGFISVIYLLHHVCQSLHLSCCTSAAECFISALQSAKPVSDFVDGVFRFTHPAEVAG